VRLIRTDFEQDLSGSIENYAQNDLGIRVPEEFP